MSVLSETFFFSQCVFHCTNQPFGKDNEKDLARNQEKYNASPVAALDDISLYVIYATDQ